MYHQDLFKGATITDNGLCHEISLTNNKPDDLPPNTPLFHGWKLHISFADASDTKKALLLLLPFLMENFITFKFLDFEKFQQRMQENGQCDFQFSKQMTLYLCERHGAPLITAENLRALIEQMTGILEDAKVAPGTLPESDVPTPSPFFSLRNDCSHRKYLSASEVGRNFNPLNLSNPYIALLPPISIFDVTEHYQKFPRRNVFEIKCAASCTMQAYLNEHFSEVHLNDLNVYHFGWNAKNPFACLVHLDRHLKPDQENPENILATAYILFSIEYYFQTHIKMTCDPGAIDLEILHGAQFQTLITEQTQALAPLFRQIESDLSQIPSLHSFENKSWEEFLAYFDSAVDAIYYMETMSYAEQRHATILDNAKEFTDIPPDKVAKLAEDFPRLMESTIKSAIPTVSPYESMSLLKHQFTYERLRCRRDSIGETALTKGENEKLLDAMIAILQETAGNTQLIPEPDFSMDETNAAYNERRLNNRRHKLRNQVMYELLPSMLEIAVSNESEVSRQMARIEALVPYNLEFALFLACIYAPNIEISNLEDMFESYRQICLPNLEKMHTYLNMVLTSSEERITELAYELRALNMREATVAADTTGEYAYSEVSDMWDSSPPEPTSEARPSAENDEGVFVKGHGFKRYHPV